MNGFRFAISIFDSLSYLSSHVSFPLVVNIFNICFMQVTYLLNNCIFLHLMILFYYILYIVCRGRHDKKTDGCLVKPFLRWAGGKSWLIKHLDEIILGKTFVNYHEPFLGGGAIFLALNHSSKVYLSDLNSELIDTYKAIKHNPDAVISVLKTFKNCKERYYEIRGQAFTDIFHKAARFIYLNQTSFNGLYRVNQQGKYNVPFGFRTKNFLEAEKLIYASKKLQNATLECGDFMKVNKRIKKGDLIFLDPPYTVSHNNNGFIKYNQKLFSLSDQERLSQLIDSIKQKNAYYILTNAAHQNIYNIFDKGDRLIKLKRANLIGGQKAQRGQVEEYVFTNIS